MNFPRAPDDLSSPVVDRLILTAATAWIAIVNKSQSIDRLDACDEVDVALELALIERQYLMPGEVVESFSCDYFCRFIRVELDDGSAFDVSTTTGAVTTRL